MAFITGVQWTVFVAQILPFVLYLAFVTVAWARGKTPPTVQAWQIATALGFSFVADAHARDMMNLSIDNNIVMHFAAPIQFGLLLFAFRPRHVFAATLAMVALTLWAGAGGFAGPEWRIQVVIGAWVAWAAFRSGDAYRWPVITYCLAGIPLAVWVLTVPNGPPTPAWLAWFGGYHTVRLLGVLGVLYVMAAPVLYPRMEAARELERRHREARGSGPVARARGLAASGERVPVRAGPAGWPY